MRAESKEASAGSYGSVNVSRGEEALFGQLAGAMRQVSLALASIEDAQARVTSVMEESRLDDSIASGQTTPPAMDEQGRTPHTAWLVSVFERVANENLALRTLYQDLAMETLTEQRERHTGLRITESIPDAFVAHPGR